MISTESQIKFSGYNRKVFWFAFLVALITIIIYLPALQNEFVNWDDDQYIYENPYIQLIDFKSLKWMFTTFHASNWHPLAWISHAIDFALWGLNPMGHHLTSVILHGLNTFLVVIVVTRLMESTKVKELSLFTMEKKRQFWVKAIMVSTATGLLFGIHPIHVESVAWVSERKDVLCAFFFLLSIIFYLKYTSSSIQREKTFRYIICLLFFIFALMSKPMAVTLPVVLLILDIYPLDRLKFSSAFIYQRSVLVEKIPFMFLSIASSVVTILAQQSGKAIASLEEYPLVERILIAFRALIFYLIKMLWPTNLSPLYPYQSKISLVHIEFIGTFILIILITAFCIWSWKNQKVFLAVWAYYFVTVFPVLGVIQVGEQAAADRYTYLPSLGPFILVGISIVYLWYKACHKRVIKFFIVSIFAINILALSIISTKQISIWKDSIELWSYEMKQFPNTITAYINRGKAYTKSNNFQEAFKDFNIALIINPKCITCYNNRGLIYMKIGRYQEALDDFNKAITFNPYRAIIYNSRGLTYMELGDYQKAMVDFNKAINLDRQFAEVYNNRGIIYRLSGKYHKAIEEYNTAINLNPIYAEAYYNRGIVHGKLGKYQQAIEDYTIALKLNSQLMRSYNNRGNAYLMLYNYQKAIEDFNIAIKFNPNDDKAYYNRGVAYENLGNYGQAISDYQIAAYLGNNDAQGYLKSKGISW